MLTHLLQPVFIEENGLIARFHNKKVVIPECTKRRFSVGSGGYVSGGCDLIKKQTNANQR